MKINFRGIEKKWQARWSKAKIFEANVGKKKKFFITFPYPYVNGAPHVGHSYSAFRTDCYARFKRMQGFNVLYPQGFHATGEPIVGTIERLNKNDPVQISTFKDFGASSKDIDRFKKDIKYVVDFWIKRWVEDLSLAGFSIDWRRTFVTTTLTPAYSRFVEWQYNTLKKKGYVTQGTHPVIWCPHDKSPTGDHDRLEGEGESPVDYILLKFQMDGLILPAATLRPETIYGVTNVWLHPDAEYVKAQVDDEIWLLSDRAAVMLSDQLKKVEIIGKIKGSELLGKKCTNPITKRNVPILPGYFVDLDSSTGIVMSVPSHAPYDWIALKELIGSEKLENYNTNKDELKPISVIFTSGLGEYPAIEICDQMKITSLNQKDKLDKATSEIYKKEFHKGVLRNAGEYDGLRVNECKEKLSIDFIERHAADILWDSEKVICRCTTRCHVKILENQWFLKFSDEKWKNLAKKCLKKMTVHPEEARTNFLNTIDWLKDKACTRKGGLGTPLPWDKSWIVETLSDSTIYMAYYTISRIINKHKIRIEQLSDNLFDYIFLGIGNVDRLSRENKISSKIVNEMKKEFEYFYPVDMRNSGKDLIQNHLTFYLFHHTAIWPEEFWPKAIGVNGFVNVEGEKMSKSKGNIIPLRNLIEQSGSDLVRINIITSSEGIDDADWRSENIKAYQSRIEFLFDLIKQMKKAKVTKERNIDLYLRSVINRQIEIVKENYEHMRFRTSVQNAFFATTNALKWYIKRCGGFKGADKKVLSESISLIVSMLTPVLPHVAEELRALLGKKGFAALSEWPKQDKKAVNNEAESGEVFISSLIRDFEEIKNIAKIKPKKLSVFVAEDWKFDVYDYVLKNKNKQINEITKDIMSTKNYSDSTIIFIQALYKKKGELSEVISRESQIVLLEEARDFIETETQCKLEIIVSEKSDHKKARQSSPAKLGMFIE